MLSILNLNYKKRNFMLPVTIDSPILCEMPYEQGESLKIWKVISRDLAKDMLEAAAESEVNSERIAANAMTLQAARYRILTLSPLNADIDYDHNITTCQLAFSILKKGELTFTLHKELSVRPSLPMDIPRSDKKKEKRFIGIFVLLKPLLAVEFQERLATNRKIVCQYMRAHHVHALSDEPYKMFCRTKREFFLKSRLEMITAAPLRVSLSSSMVSAPRAPTFVTIEAYAFPAVRAASAVIGAGAARVASAPVVAVGAGVPVAIPLSAIGAGADAARAASGADAARAASGADAARAASGADAARAASGADAARAASGADAARAASGADAARAASGADAARAASGADAARAASGADAARAASGADAARAASGADAARAASVPTAASSHFHPTFPQGVGDKAEDFDIPRGFHVTRPPTRRNNLSSHYMRAHDEETVVDRPGTARGERRAFLPSSIVSAPGAASSFITVESLTTPRAASAPVAPALTFAATAASSPIFPSVSTPAALASSVPAAMSAVHLMVRSPRDAGIVRSTFRDGPGDFHNAWRTRPKLKSKFDGTRFPHLAKERQTPLPSSTVSVPGAITAEQLIAPAAPTLTPAASASFPAASASAPVARALHSTLAPGAGAGAGADGPFMIKVFPPPAHMVTAYRNEPKKEKVSDPYRLDIPSAPSFCSRHKITAKRHITMIVFHRPTSRVKLFFQFS